MKTSRILELTNVVPPHVNLFTTAHGVKLPPQIVWADQEAQFAWALYAPEFPWAYAAAFADAKLPLPPLVHEPAIREAYNYLTAGRRSDDLRGALMLRQAPMKNQESLLRALLIMPSVSLDQIAEIMSMSVGAIKMYSELWFAVRDRLDDQCFIASIVYPNTRQVEFMPDYWQTVQPDELLLRTAHNTGSAEVVLELYGAVLSGNRLSEEELIKLIRVNILAQAAWLAEAGLVHQPLRVFDLAVKMINASKRAAARAQAAPRAVGAWTAASTQPKPQSSILEAAKAAVAGSRIASAPSEKERQNKVVADASSRSYRSYPSSRSFDGQIPPTVSQRHTTVSIGSPDTMVFTQTKLFPDRRIHALEESTLREWDCVMRETELPVVGE